MSAADDARARLRNAVWLEKAAPFLDILDGANGRSRVVGGLVRDTVLGIDRSTTDIDMASVFEPAEVMERGKRAGFAVHPTGVEHGTVTLVAHGVSAEVTTLRHDIETFGRHARVRFGTDWEADARRRDFTMNALYAGHDGELFDPVSGLADCLARCVRFIGDADARIAEDRLRVYRYFRFCATHGEQQFNDDALAACRRAANALDQLSAERIGAEMLKLLNAPRCVLALGHMTKMAVLGSDVVPEDAFPALSRLESGENTTSATARMAVIAAHDVSLDGLQKRWRLSNALCKRAAALVAGAELAGGGQTKELVYRFRAVWEDAIAVAAAIADWPQDRAREMLAAAASISPGPFPVNGQDLLAAGVPAGKAMGETLRSLEKDWIESGFQLDRQALLDRIRLP